MAKKKKETVANPKKALFVEAKKAGATDIAAAFYADGKITLEQATGKK